MITNELIESNLFKILNFSIIIRVLVKLNRYKLEFELEIILIQIQQYLSILVFTDKTLKIFDIFKISSSAGKTITGINASQHLKS